MLCIDNSRKVVYPMAKRIQLTIRLTPAQKAFLQKQAEEEHRTITAIVQMALKEKYPEYAHIFNKQKDYKKGEMET